MAKHYIITDETGRILRGFSDDFEQPTDGAICINEDGGRHFELNGVINPSMSDCNGVPLYAFDGKKIIKRDEKEVAAETPIPVKTVTIEERVQAVEIAVKELATNGVGTAELEAALAEIEAAGDPAEVQDMQDALVAGGLQAP